MGVETLPPPPIRATPTLAVDPRPLRTATPPTNLCRKGVWHVGPLQLALPIEDRDVLGLVRTDGPPLGPLEMDVFSWLCTLHGRQGPEGLEPIHFTRYRLCKDLFGRKPGGKESRLVHESLTKLARARLTMEVWDPDDKTMGLAGEGLDAGLVASFGWAKDYARAVMTAAPKELARIAGSKRGSSTYWVHLDPWIVKHLRAGHLTYLEWRVTRHLSGLAKRLYYLLSAESGFKRNGRPGETAKYLALEHPLMVTLGITDEHKARARAQLRRAAEAVVAADRSFAAIDVVRRGPGRWGMLVTRRLASELPR